MPLRILFRLLSVVALSLGSLVGIAAFDLTCNSSKLLKSLLEKALSSSNLRVSIEAVEPNYFARQITISNLKAYRQGRSVASLKSAECFFSFKTLEKVEVNIKASELLSCEFPLHLDAFNAKASFSLFTKCKDALAYSSDGRLLAQVSFEGSTISACIEPALSPNIIRSQCNVDLRLSPQGEIMELTSSGDLDELNIHLNDKHLSQIALSSVTWNCKVDSRILNAVEKQELEFKANFHKAGKYCFRVSGKLSAGDATILLNSASGDHQAFHLKAESNVLKGSGPVQGGLCSMIKSFKELGFLQNTSVVNAKKDTCNWDASFNLLDRKFNALVSSSFESCKFILGSNAISMSDSHARLMLTNSNYHLSLDSIIDSSLRINTEVEGNGTSHFFKGSVKAEKELYFPEATLIVKPAICTFTGSAEKKDKLCFHVASNVSEVSFLFDKYGFVQDAGNSAELKLSGVFYGPVGAVQGTFIAEGKSAVSGTYFTDGNVTQIDLDNVVYAKSNYKLKAESAQEHLKTEIVGTALDLSSANLSAWVVPKYRTKPKEIVAAFDNLYMKDDKAVSNVAMYSTYNGKHYTGCLFQGGLGPTGFINVTLDGSDSDNVSEGWVCRANDLGYVMQALGLYRGVKSGLLDLAFDIDRIRVTQEDPAPLVHGNIRLHKFRVERIPFLLWATCPSALARLFAESKYSNFESAYANFCILGKELSIERGNVKSFSSDIVLYKSKISPNGVLLRGGVAPSWYGLGNLVRWTPIVGDMLELIQLPGVWIPFVWKKEFN